MNANDIELLDAPEMLRMLLSGPCGGDNSISKGVPPTLGDEIYGKGQRLPYAGRIISDAFPQDFSPEDIILFNGAFDDLVEGEVYLLRDLRLRVLRDGYFQRGDGTERVPVEDVPIDDVCAVVVASIARSPETFFL